MHPNAERIQAALAETGAHGRVVEFDSSTKTSVDAARAIGTTVAQIAKSLVFLAGERPVLVIASGVNRVDVDKLSSLLGAVIRRADASAVRDATGFPIGGVPPFGHTQELEVLVDEELLVHSEIWAAAGTPNAVFPTSPDELLRITGGRVADVKEEDR